ncbi:MAG: prepilin-type N-terminal cleavage/methylation domain-containing protein [Sedimentisphaerales bacterium]|nr:prepilin-type N-terminal cleavage/methylation domain-containing protein [Sedimentisphaerales bacterium]
MYPKTTHENGKQSDIGRIQRYKRRRKKGLSIVEILIALAIAALLLTATAVAFEAAFKSYSANHDMAVVSVSTRNALYQMSATIRSAWNDPDIETINVNLDGTECALVDASGRDVIYRYDAGSSEIQVNINGDTNWYALVEDVSPLSAGEDIFTIVDPADPDFPVGTVGKVIIKFKVEREGVTHPVITSAVPRNIVY